MNTYTKITLNTIKTLFKLNRLNHYSQLDNNPVQYVSIKIQKSTSSYIATCLERKKQSFHYTETERLRKEHENVESVRR